MPEVDLKSWGPVTVLLVLLTVGVITVGGIIVITHPETLDFQQYIDTLKNFAIALGVLGVGRGLKIGLEKQVDEGALPNGDHVFANLPVANPQTIVPDEVDMQELDDTEPAPIVNQTHQGPVQ